ncbi:MAG: sulfite exporter TauE/SafE family protein [Treponema sp.]|nr:sulfite exporter TauE/SafE family protein [Treponema sp.]
MSAQGKKVLCLSIGGMSCIACQAKIQSTLGKLPGVTSAEVSWKNGTARIEGEGEKISTGKITKEIESLGYTVRHEDSAHSGYLRSALCLALIALLFFILQKTNVLNLLAPSLPASSKTGFALLFATGLFTSVHCLAMCGGINVSQSLVRTGRIALPAVLYNSGRIVSYTAAGAVLGLVGMKAGGGSGNGDFVPIFVQSLLKLFAGLFMILSGLSLLGVLTPLRRFLPHIPASAAKKIASAGMRAKKTFIVGFLNGFMPCGPLQAMWIVALASSHPISGALSMLSFGLGTVPLMLALGSIFSIIGKKYTEVVMKIGSLLVVVMGLSMLSQSFALGGFNTGRLFPKSQQAQEQAVEKDGTQTLSSTLGPYAYPSITVKKGVPVRWEINAGEGALNGCNYKMIFQDFGFEKTLSPGKNIIEFTADRAGTFQYSCWMGMIRGTIRVEE